MLIGVLVYGISGTGGFRFREVVYLWMRYGAWPLMGQLVTGMGVDGAVSYRHVR